MFVPIKKTALIVLLIAAPLALWLIEKDDDIQPYSEEGKSHTAKQIKLDQVVNEVIQDPVLEIIASTPKSHDQLVISSSQEGTDIDGALKA